MLLKARSKFQAFSFNSYYLNPCNFRLLVTGFRKAENEIKLPTFTDYGKKQESSETPFRFIDYAAFDCAITTTSKISRWILASSDLASEKLYTAGQLIAEAGHNNRSFLNRKRSIVKVALSLHLFNFMRAHHEKLADWMKHSQIRSRWKNIDNSQIC